jgi:hypothetical protein
MLNDIYPKTNKSITKNNKKKSYLPVFIKNEKKICQKKEKRKIELMNDFSFYKSIN